MPKKTAVLLREFGIKARTADEEGWAALMNGTLISAAVKAGFHCILTRDRLFSNPQPGHFANSPFFA